MFNYSIPGANAAESITYQFNGLDRRARVPDGACRDMRNMSTDDCPCLSPRKGRRKIEEYQAATLLLHKNGKPLVVDGTAVKYDGQKVGEVTAGRKRAAVMNDWVFLWPDKVAFNAVTLEFCSMEASAGPLAVSFTNATVTRKDGQDWPFKKGDGVTIEGCSQSYNNRTSVVQEVEGDKLVFYDNVFCFGEPGSDEDIHTNKWEEPSARFSRTVPDLAYVCEKDNRLWGVYENHICCSKLGDGFNWNVFNGLATDAYDVGVGSDGPFTGITGFASYILAFKEACVHKLYGTKPSNFTLYTTPVSGVQDGCAETIQVYNNRLFYLSRDGVMAFGGGTPEPVGQQLNRSYTRAVAGMDGTKYVLSGVSEQGAEIVVYDSERNLWAREDETEAACFSSDGGTLWMLDADGGLWQCGTEDPVEWEAVFGPFENLRDGKFRSSRLSMVLNGEPGAVAEVSTKVDGTGWRTIWKGRARRFDGVIQAPHLPVRGHEFWIRLRGKGRVTLRAINRWTHEGSAR